MKMARHLERHHASEVEVQRILAMQKRSKWRFEAFQELKNKGSYIHNMKVIRGAKEGDIVPWRRAAVGDGSGTKDVDDSLVCEDCQAFFLRKTLWHHRRYCTKKSGKISRGRVQVRARSLIHHSRGTSEGLKRILRQYECG